ncbi:hypothetical protein KAI87_14440 [Myxococcota bacterium]|nr:hypothetical protein [Myxococcota bacterium]
MAKSYRRVNVVIGEEQYKILTERGLNLSGLVRDLLGDYLSDNTITLQVSAETRSLYDMVISNMGATDEDLEIYVRQALARVLEQRIGEMQALHDSLKEELPAD